LDRTIVYPGAIPLETDLLNTNRNTLTALSSLTQDLFGSNTLFSGLNCVPSNPASMSVSITPGRVYALQNRDTVAYSSLGADTTHQLMKQGILLDAQIFSCPAPQTSGFSVNYLISANFIEQDINPVVLPYYDEANPAQAFSGPPVNGNSSGTAQNTTRQDTVQLTLTPGVATATGNQVTPAAPTGATPLWVITVAYGQTSINAANIAAALNSPFAPTGGYFAAVGERYSGIQNIATSSTLTTAALGALVNVTATGTTQTLPPAANCPNGTSITIVYMQSSGSAIVAHNGSDTLVFGQGNNSAAIMLSPGEEVQFVSNGVNGWVSAGQTLSTGVTPPQFDNSTKLATTAFLKKSGMQHSAPLIFSNSGALAASAVIGNFVIFYGNTTPLSVSLPASNTCPQGGAISILNASQSPVTLTPGSAGDYINPSSNNLSSVVLQAGDTFNVSLVGTSWEAFGGSACLAYASIFNSSINSNGYQKLPSGIIMQWGTTLGTGNNDVFQLPIAFPHATLCGWATDAGAGLHSCAFIAGSQTSITLSGGTSGGTTLTTNYRWLCIGY